MTTALVLAAGKATRLAGIREHYAKACVPVAGTTPMAFLLQALHEAGVQRAVVNLHYRPDQVEAAARASAPQGLELEFFREPRLLGTGGTLLAVAEEQGLPDLIANAKIFTDLEFRRTLGMPRPAVVLHPASDLSEFGGLTFRDGRVTGLRPRAGKVREPRAAVFTGICRPSEKWLPLLRRARAEAPEEALCLLRHGLLPGLKDGVGVHAMLHSGSWHEISTPERLERADRMLRQRAKLFRAR